MIKLLHRWVIFAACAAGCLHAQNQVTFAISGTVTLATDGYAANAPLTFTFVLNSPTAPTGGSHYGFNSIDWFKTGLSPALYSAVTGTGLTGTWTGTDSSSQSTDDEIVGNTVSNALNLYTTVTSGDLLLLTPDSHGVTWISITGQWTGLTLSNVGIADPIAYFAARAGTYSLIASTDSVRFWDSAATQIPFVPSSLTISASAIPEPATDAILAGLSGFSVALFLRRRSRQIV